MNLIAAILCRLHERQKTADIWEMLTQAFSWKPITNCKEVFALS